MQIINLVQGSPDWLQWRSTGIGGSDAPVIWHGKHFQTTIEKLFLEKAVSLHGIEKVEEIFNIKIKKKIKTGKAENSAMKMGKDAEPFIKEWYEGWLNVKAPSLCAVHDYYKWLKGSLDGYVQLENRNINVEIKRPGVKWNGESDHYTALENRVPEKYIPQLLHLHLLTGASESHYVSEGDEKVFKGLERRVIVKFVPNKQDLQKLFDLELKFWSCLENLETDYLEG